MTTHTLESEIVLIETIKINNYKYELSNFVPHDSVQYHIYCYNDDVFIKHVTGMISGQEYLDWIDDDYLDNYIKVKVQAIQ